MGHMVGAEGAAGLLLLLFVDSFCCTAEFYRERALITRRLIEEKGFCCLGELSYVHCRK